MQHISETEEWKKIKHFVYNHPVYSALDDADKDKSVAELYEKHRNDVDAFKDQELLSEYVDMYMMGGMGIGSYNNSPNSGPDRFAYGNIGQTTVPGSNAFGNKSRQGIRVYGMPGGVGDSSGVAPIGNAANGVEPAEVIIPDKKSSYEPWKTEMSSDGITTQPQEKKIKDKSANDTFWSSPAGDIVMDLEDEYGISSEELSKMTQEEIEDLIVRIVKKEQQDDIVNESKQYISGLSLKDKLVESFLYGEECEEELDEGKSRKSSKIQDARDILSSKHQQKKVVEKGNDNAYVVNQYGIEKLMKKFGYYFNTDAKKWLKRKPDQIGSGTQAQSAGGEKKGSKSSSQPQQSMVGEYTPPENTLSDNLPLQQSPIPKEKEPDEEEEKPEDAQQKPDDKESMTKKSSDNGPTVTQPMQEPDIKNAVKSLSARFILCYAHTDSSALSFNEPAQEGGPAKPVINDETILEKMKMLGYDWDDDKLRWNDQNMSLPSVLFDIGESKKTIIGRAYLAATETLDYVLKDETGMPRTPVGEVVSKMESQGFIWNLDDGMWEFYGSDVGELIKESVQLSEAPIQQNQKIKKQKDMFGYDARAAEEYLARYSLKAYQVVYMGDLVQNSNDPTEITTAKKEFTDLDPVASQRLPKFNMASFGAVTRKLTSLGYTRKDFGYLKFWSDTDNIPSHVEKVVPDEDFESFIGRGIVTDETKDVRFITFDGELDKPDEMEPSENPERVKSSLESNDFHWDQKQGWMQNSPEQHGQQSIDYADTSKMDQDQLSHYNSERNILSKFGQSDWDTMTSRDKDSYKEALINQRARVASGLDPAQWYSMDEFNKSRFKAKYKRNYKFDPKTKSFVKREKPLFIGTDNGATNISLTQGIKNAASSLVKAGKTGAGLLGKLIQLGKLQA